LEDPAISAPIPDRVAGIAARNGCTAEPSIESLPAEPGEPVERWTWACPTGAEVELLTYSADHVWPAEWDAGIDGTEFAWEFFEQHPMPEYPEPKYLAREGAPELAPYGCWIDYPMFAAMHVRLDRAETIAQGGPRRDFRMSRGEPVEVEPGFLHA
jgi:hypothetical protein